MKIYRNILNDIEKWIGKPKILILKGARQVGKTTILKFLEHKLKKKNKAVKYFSIDAELDNPLFKDVNLLIKFIKDQYSGKFLYLFLDEFQYIKNAGLFLKVLFDELENSCQIIVSGSSSLEITKNSEFLTGRKISFTVRTLSFNEFINYKSENQFNQFFNLDELKQLSSFNSIYSNELQNLLIEYLNYGGYPEICTVSDYENKIIILKELISTYIQKDITAFFKIQNITGFNNLLKVLINQSGNLVNKNELSNSLNLGHDTINKYLALLEGTYVLNFIKPFFKNVRKELTKMPKVYSSDFGFNKILTRIADIDSYDFIDGSIVENFIFKELQNKFSDENIFFFRTVSKAEIDFIIQKENKLIPLEVKFSRKQTTLPVVMKNFNINFQNIDKNIIITKNNLNYNEELNCFFIPVYLLPFILL